MKHSSSNRSIAGRNTLQDTDKAQDQARGFVTRAIVLRPSPEQECDQDSGDALIREVQKPDLAPFVVQKTFLYIILVVDADVCNHNTR